MRPRILLLTILALFLLASGCSGLIPGGGSDGNATQVPKTIVYDGAITVSVKNSQNLAGTTIGYQGKSADGRALLVIDGLQAPKQTADSVTFKGSQFPGVLIGLNTRVGTYDQNTVNLFGTIHIEIQDPRPDARPPASEMITAFSIPVQYYVNLNDAIPGTLIQYLGNSPDGAKFSNVGEFPYRQQFDSIVWSGHLRDKVGLHLDLRLISAADDKAAVFGTAQVRFEK